MKHLFTVSCLIVAAAGQGALLTEAKAAQNTCADAEQSAAPRLLRVEPAGEESDRFAVFWTLDAPTQVPNIYQPVLGGNFQVVRCLPPGKWITVGKGTVTSATGSLVEAISTPVQQPQSTNWRTEFAQSAKAANLYWRPMAGDFVLPVQTLVTQRPVIFPREKFPLRKLFAKDENGSLALDLSPEGKQQLAAAFQKFAAFRGRVAVECSANRPGQREALREETQLRAAAVVRYLTRNFNLEEGRVLAIGLGSDGFRPEGEEIPEWPEQRSSENITLRVIQE